jgi:ribosomal protein L10
MSAKSVMDLKLKAKAKDWTILHISNGLFRAAVNTNFGDPKINELAQIGVLPVGNCILAYSNASDLVRPKLLADLGTCLKGNDQVDLIGGIFDKMLLTNEKIKFVSKMPSLSIQRQMLVSLLSTPAQRLVNVLSQNQSGLLNVLNLHKSQLTKE